MYYLLPYTVLIWLVDHVASGERCIHAFHILDNTSCNVRRQHQQSVVGRDAAVDRCRRNYHSTIHPKAIQAQQQPHRLIFGTDHLRQRRDNIILKAIHEPQSDISSTDTLSTWSPSSLFKSIRMKDRHQLASIVRASVIIGLSSYYFYKGLYSISSSVSFWKAEGDLILHEQSVATWGAELIGLITLSKSMVYLLVILTQMSPLQSAALSGIPCLLYLLRGILTQSLMRIGFNPFFAPLVISYATLINILTFTTIIPPEQLKKYLYMPLVAAGIFAWSLPTTSATMFGVQLKTAMDKVLWIFVGRSLISTGTLIYSLALEGNIKPRFGVLSKAMRNMTASTAATTIIDFVFTRRNELLAAGFSMNKAYRFILFSLTASGLLYAIPGP